MGGGLYGASLTSTWGTNMTTTFTVGYNNKGGNGLDSYEGRFRPDPNLQVHDTVRLEGGRLVGSGSIVRAGGTRALSCASCMLVDKGSMPQLRGDLTRFKSGWGGSHEFKTGFLAMPRVKFERTTIFNDRIVTEDRCW